MVVDPSYLIFVINIWFKAIFLEYQMMESVQRVPWQDQKTHVAAEMIVVGISVHGSYRRETVYETRLDAFGMNSQKLIGSPYAQTERILYVVG